MKLLRHVFHGSRLIIATIVLSACAVNQAVPFASPALTPQLSAISTSGAPSSQPSRTPFATRTPKIDREALTPLPTLSLTPTLDVKSYTNSWGRFSDHIYGISIEYPLIYREKPYQGVCDPFETWDGIHFGENSVVFVRQQSGTSLAKHIESFLLRYHPDEPFQLESQEAVPVNNQPAISLKYKLDNATEIREWVFVMVSESNLIYTFSFIGGSACNVAEIGISERTLFEHALETFYVVR